MRHLVVPIYCVVVASALLALLIRAVRTEAATFVLLFLCGFLFFAIRCWVETRNAWPAFSADMARRRARRQRAP